MVVATRPLRPWNSLSAVLPLLVALAIAVSARAGSAADIGVTITGDAFSTAAYADGWFSDPDSVTVVDNVTVPLATTTQADALDGSASATSTFSFAETNDGLAFDIDFSGSLTGGGLSSVFGDITLTVTESVHYQFSADFSGFGVENVDNLLVSFSLREVDEDGDFVGMVFQEVDDALTGPVAIDGMSNVASPIGTQNGTLNPGTYDVLASFRIDNFGQNPGATGQAEGSFTLLLVPEPGTGALLTLGLAVLGATRRR